SCRYCGDSNKTSLHLASPGDWKFRKSGLFEKDNNQEGAIPVILTVLTIGRIFHFEKFAYSFSLSLKGDYDECESDLAVLNFRVGWHMEEPEIGIGECKSVGGRIEDEDIANLTRVAGALRKRRLQPFLIFSKTADSFTPDEIERFRQLRQAGQDCVLL